MSTRQESRKPARPGSTRTRHNPFAIFIAAILVGLLAVISPASAEDMAESYVVAGEVAPDGTLSITETITFDGAGPAELVQRLATTRQGLDYTQLNYEITDITVTSDGQDLAPSITTDGDYQVITVDASQTDQPIVISYQVKGAAVALPAVTDQPDATEMSWRVLQGLSVGVQEVSGEIALPQGTQTNDIDCQAGPPSNTMSCRTYAAGTFEATYPQFTDGPRGSGEVVVLSFSMPSSAVAPNQMLTEQWTLDRAFSAGPIQLAVALGTLLLGALGLWLLHRAHGADTAGGEPTLVGTFEPVAAGEERFKLVTQMYPGEVGTLADERVDPIDIAATVVDLAQRGHLTIVELPRQSVHAPLDWTFERGAGGDELHAYEQTLLDALAPVDGEAATVSHISEPVSEVIPTVQEQIYDEVVKEGWFAARPDAVRSNWARIGAIAVIAALIALGLLVAFTKFALTGLVLVGLAVALIWISGQMPRRTAKGSSVLKGLDGLAMSLATRPTSNVPKQDAYAEISRILPYAIVLGGTDRWIQALVDADDDPGVPDPDDLGWYRAPETWQLSDLPGSLDALITTLEGKLFGRH